MKTKVNEIYIYSRGQSAPEREFTRGRDWRERYFSILMGLAGKVFFDSFYNMDDARSNSCQKLVWDISTVKDDKIYRVN
jgi:hypothetical protein